MASKIDSGFRCNVEVWHGFDHLISTDFVDLSEAMALRDDYLKEAILCAAKHGCRKNLLYCVTQYNFDLDIVDTMSFFLATDADMDVMGNYRRTMPDAEFDILYAPVYREFCEEALRKERSMRIVPLTLREANDFVRENHRHHDSVTGCKFAIGLTQENQIGKPELIGVAICGRPVSRLLDNGSTLEINRVCTTGPENACSMLYGACKRIAKEMGYRKVITYTLENEPGTSLRASGFILEDPCCGGPKWNGKRSERGHHDKRRPPESYKQRWALVLA